MASNEIKKLRKKLKRLLNADNPSYFQNQINKLKKRLKELGDDRLYDKEDIEEANRQEAECRERLRQEKEASEEEQRRIEDLRTQEYQERFYYRVKTGKGIHGKGRGFFKAKRRPS